LKSWVPEHPWHRAKLAEYGPLQNPLKLGWDEQLAYCIGVKQKLAANPD
jgi:hypothetical protein